MRVFLASMIVQLVAALKTDTNYNDTIKGTINHNFHIIQKQSWLKINYNCNGIYQYQNLHFCSFNFLFLDNMAIDVAIVNQKQKNVMKQLNQAIADEKAKLFINKGLSEQAHRRISLMKNRDSMIFQHENSKAQ